jgi:hypothetical protein
LSKWWAAGECSVKEKGRAATSLSLAEEGRSGSVVGGSSLFFFCPKKRRGLRLVYSERKKGQWLRKWRVCGQLKREDQLTRGRRKMDQYASRGVAAFCLDQFIYRRSVNRFPNWSLNFSFSLFFFSFFM